MKASFQNKNTSFGCLKKYNQFYVAYEKEAATNQRDCSEKFHVRQSHFQDS